MPLGHREDFLSVHLRPLSQQVVVDGQAGHTHTLNPAHQGQLHPT